MDLEVIYGDDSYSSYSGSGYSDSDNNNNNNNLSEEEYKELLRKSYQIKAGKYVFIDMMPGADYVQTPEELKYFYIPGLKNVVDKIEDLEKRTGPLLIKFNAALAEKLANIYKIMYNNFHVLMLSTFYELDWMEWQSHLNIALQLHKINFWVMDEDDVDEYMELYDKSMEELGYVWRYFGYFRKDNLLIQAKLGKTSLTLTPDLFEMGSQTLPTGERKYKDYLPVLGWSKKDLVNAIKNSGLMKPPRHQAKDKGKLFLYVDDVGDIENINKELTLGMGGYYYAYPRGYFAGLTSKHPYRRIVYYETLYRKIYGTTSFIDWGVICGKYTVSLNHMRRIAIDTYGLEYNKIKGLNQRQLCKLLRDININRNYATKNVAESLADISTLARREILYKPYSSLVNPPSRSQFVEGAKIIHPYDQYIEIKRLCNGNRRKDDLIRGIINMGIRNVLPENIEMYGKDEICDYLIDTYKPRAEKYEKIYFDCRDDSVNKRFIIQTAIIMGLGGILPENVNELNKKELCDMINKYLNVLEDTKSTYTRYN